MLLIPTHTGLVMKRAEATITMSMRELDRIKIVQAVIDGTMKSGHAAERLQLTSRQVRRLVRRYQSEGPTGLVSKRRGRPGNHQLPAGIESRARTLLRERYADFGPTLASEKLAECHGLPLAKETVRRIMRDAGLWTPRKLRPPKVYQPRNRRACLGELIQIDGSEHAWFEDRGPTCTLLVYVDDATSRLMHMQFVPSESTFTYFSATRAYLAKHGKPQAFYSDKASVFRVNRKNATGGDGHTQFARAMYELCIEAICANSSQAKGRVERAHLTLQDRLIKELRLRGISTMDEANAFVPHYIADHNARFAKPPKSDHDAHRLMRDDEDLDAIFTWREPRCVSQNLTIQYDKVLYLIEDSEATRSLAGQYIDVFQYPDGRIALRAQGHPLPLLYTIYDRLSEVDQGAIVENKRLGHMLRVAQEIQSVRDNRRSLSCPSLVHAGSEPRRRGRPPGKKSQRSIDSADVQRALQVVTA